MYVCMYVYNLKIPLNVSITFPILHICTNTDTRWTDS